MLDSLDTLIAFILIMLVVSLLITIVVQMCAAVLNLRGRNLLSGLQSAIAVIDPGLEKQKKELARYVLKGGLLSDSFLADSFLDKWQKRTGVSWLAHLLNFWRHASAIRPSEVFDAVHRIAIAKETADADVKANARALLKALGVTEDTLKTAEQQIDDAKTKAKDLSDGAKRELDTLQAVIATVGSILPAEQKQQRMAEITAVVGNIQSAFENQIENITNEVKAYGTSAATRAVAAAGTMDSAYEKFEYWVCIGQERAQQWVTMHTRILTVIFAFVFAFALQLDTVEIFKLVASNKTVRDKLVAQAGVVETQASNLLADNSNVLKSALNGWSDEQTDPLLKEALVKVQAEVTPTDTREMVRNKVAAAFKDKGQPVGSFDACVKDAVIKKLDKKAGDFKEVKGDLDKTGFQLFPESKSGRWKRGQGFWFGWWTGSRGHRWGILFSVGLLSLGAPFWYGALKNLVDLRSQVAQNISQEQKQKQAEPDKVPPPAKAPPTVKS